MFMENPNFTGSLKKNVIGHMIFFKYISIRLEDSCEKLTWDPWATSLNWETSLNQYIYLLKAMIIS